MLSRSNVVCTLIVLLLVPGGLSWARESEVRELDWKDPPAWKHDGLWKITRCEEGIEFLKDEKGAHNSMCWMRLKEPLKRGQAVEITYKMEVPFKHIDMYLGQDCIWPARSEWKDLLEKGKSFPDFAEVLSLGGRPETDWLTMRQRITSDEKINTLGFSSWGWHWKHRGLDVDVDTWMKVKEIKVLPVEGDSAEWFKWERPLPINTKQIPERNPMQDFFPFGVYIALGDSSRAAAHEGKSLWEWLDESLADLKSRGMNCISMVNFSETELDKLIEMHKKHGLKFNPQPGQFDVKAVGVEGAMKRLEKAVPKYADSGVIAGWGAGEEFDPPDVAKLKPIHDLVHRLDPNNTLATIHNWGPCYWHAGNELDVRIAIKDVYPWFGNPYVGPFTFESQINYYEDEINKSLQMLPQGATLWAMPQGQGEAGPVGQGGYIRTTSTAEIRLQAWSAIAHGAQGLLYFIYHSEGTPQYVKFDGLRALDGSATDRLKELTKLAGQLVPVGDTITSWHRSRISAETDNRRVRAYLFKGRDDKGYVVVYNRWAESPSAARVRLPFKVGQTISDIISSVEYPVEYKNGKSMFSVSLESGSGAIISLGQRL